MNWPQELYTYLDTHDIQYTYIEHIPVYTVAESESVKYNIPGTHTKNLFLTDKSWWFVLVTVEAHKKFPTNALRRYIWLKNLSFWSAEQMMQQLQLTPGSVSLFWLINASTDLKVYIDKSLRDADQVWRHPNSNDATLVLTHNMLEKFMKSTGHTYEVIDWDENGIIFQKIF